MRLTIAYSKIKRRNLVLINNATYQRETLSERPIRQPLKGWHHLLSSLTHMFLSNIVEYDQIIKIFVLITKRVESFWLSFSFLSFFLSFFFHYGTHFDF